MSILSKGTVLKIGNGATPTEVFTAIAGVTNFTAPNPSRTVIDTTTLSSAAKEFRMGLVDNGEVTFDINYEPGEGTHATLEGMLNEDEPTNFELVYSSGAKEAFAAYVTSLSSEGSVDAIVTASVTLKLTGAVTRTAAA